MEAQGAEDDAHITVAERRAAREARQRSQDCRNPCVYIDTEHWLKTHGRPPAPKLTTEQLAQLSESFKLIDSDGGGTVDAGELGAALQLLGVNAGKAEIHAMLEKVGADENAELTPNQFNRVMTEVLTKKEAPAGSRNLGSQEDAGNMTSCLSFETTASIYRRKKLMQALVERDHATLATLMSQVPSDAPVAASRSSFAAAPVAV